MGLRRRPPGWIAVALVLAAIVALVWRSPGARRGAGNESTTKAVDLSRLIRRAHEQPGTIARVVFDPGPQQIEATLRSGTQLDAHYPSPQAQIRFQEVLEKRGIDFASKAPPSNGGSGWWGILLGWLLPFALLAAVWIYVRRRMGGAGGGQAGPLLGFGRSRARRISPTAPQTTYADVAGAQEAVDEVSEIRDFLADPGRFRALGARIPKGVLLYGPPGSGKTLLARATAGEAGVPFFTISGSDFVEMFVGVGASRVRDLFDQAKRTAPAIVFIDELDAVGRHRGAGLGGGHDEREQTLNQLLVEMDGFDRNQDVVVMAATNRPDILDPALLRPGRFDRQIVVDRPDRAGRRLILEVHARGKPLAPEADLDRLAAATPGFTGADLANLLNEAALLAGRERRSAVSQADLDEATLRVVAGPEKRSRVLTDRERAVAAYHEAGHALLGRYLEQAEKPQKISIIGRGRALGFTLSLPGEDRFLTVRSELMDRLATTLGGRAAEEIVFDEISTGAANDLEKVTDTATQMVTRFGMSDELGPRVVQTGQGDGPFLGRQLAQAPEHSEELARAVDREVRRILEAAYATALRVLREHEDGLHAVARVLIEEETIGREQFERVLAAQGDRDEPIAREAEAAEERAV